MASGKKGSFTRADGRGPQDLRAVNFRPGIAPAAKGSVLIAMGDTQVVCGASVEEGIPRWMRTQKVAGGWITAEYSMLPYASAERHSRESSTGRVGGRTQEIQRLIGRSLRAVTNLEKLGHRTLWIDCDVLQADGGTRTAAITGGYVALRLAVDALMREGLLEEDPIREAVAAVSVGIVNGTPLLDICYAEDLVAEVDMNVVMAASNRFVEVQGTAESEPFSKHVMQKMMSLAESGIQELIKSQKALMK